MTDVRIPIKELAEQSGFGWDDKYHWYVGSRQMEKFAALIASQEREACAKFVQNCNGELGCEGYLIRARGEKP